MKLAIIGAGKMGSAIMIGALNAKVLMPEDIGIYDANQDLLQTLSQEHGVKVLIKDNLDSAERVLIAVKPQIFELVAPLIANKYQAYLSIMAGITLETISTAVQSNRVIRHMPNLGAAVAQSATALAPKEGSTEEDIAFAKTLFSSIGKVYPMPEKLIDAFTGLAGSSPAFVALFAEALADGGVRMGFSRDMAQDIAQQVLAGTAAILASKKPADLKDEVSSAGGTTIAGVKALEKEAFRHTVMQAVEDAANRAKELGQS